jgi:hypothetical protein
MRTAIDTLLTLACLVCLSRPAGAQSLVEAADAAKAAHATGMGWPVSANSVPSAAAAAATLKAAPAPAVDEIAPASTTDAKTASTPAVRGDASLWKTRMRVLRTQIDNDRGFLAAVVTREHTLDLEVHRDVTHVNAIRDRQQLAVLTSSWQDAVTEVSRLKVLVQNDTRAIANLELEAHRVGLPPGWLVLE